MSKPKPYQGHRSRNAWNINLWLRNDADLYGAMCDAIAVHSTLDEAARALLDQLQERTPDGVRYTRLGILEAMRRYEATQVASRPLHATA